MISTTINSALKASPAHAGLGIGPVTLVFRQRFGQQRLIAGGITGTSCAK
jgi:hypothetical protein